ncbi:sensor histidine kinase [Salinibacterium sp. G-O1]|uniref:sensor histidine kinase n=1 Tax=Salinibacterium sp. G-O1 TaxID=3046208 RepID=UPI0024B8D454|nr:sensor histidine kinase [Salinibacterium sp. G-O1]MDJ0335373.1 sensor histidine kinase [Salinibacterium sp. G-O1]
MPLPSHIDRYGSRPPPMFLLSSRARLLMPVILSLLVQLPANLFWLAQYRSVAAWISVGLAVLGPLALLLIRRHPGPVVAFVSLAACLDFVLSERMQGGQFLALAFAIILSIARGARIWAWISVGVGWVGTITVGLLTGTDWHPARIAVTTLGILITFGIGEGLRSRREHIVEFRREQLQRQQTEVQAERVRIARELHDVLAHSLSQINVQAGVGLHLMEKQPAKAAEALASIKETSKTALDEVRSVLGLLRAEAGQDPSAPLVPEPDLSRLAGLVASVSSQGVDVTLDSNVTEAPKAAQLAIYRIVQESLTNVVRHAQASSVHVRVAADDHDYVVTVGDDGRGMSESPVSGRGLLGMRERAELLGGSLDVGTAPGGGTLITARIPHTERNPRGTT